MLRFTVASCHFAWCKREKLVGHHVDYKWTGSPCVARGTWRFLSLCSNVSFFCVLPVMACFFFFFFLFLTIHFFFFQELSFPVSWLFIEPKRPIGQLKHSRMCIWSKLLTLTRRMEPRRWWKVIIQGGEGRGGTWVKSTSCGRKGTSSLYCQRLIRSGIKHFVTVQAEQRGRDIGWMLLCPLCSEPLH